MRRLPVLLLSIAFAAVLGAAQPAAATVIFSDDFEAETAPQTSSTSPRS